MNPRSLTLRQTIIFATTILGFASLLGALYVMDHFSQQVRDSQFNAGEELLAQTTKNTLEEHSDLIEDLGLEIQHNLVFKQAFLNKQYDKITSLLDDEFMQYYITAGVIKVNKIYALNNQYEIVAESTLGNSYKITTHLCPNQIALAKLRKGIDRHKKLSGWCLSNGYGFESTIVPIGTLKIAGYIQLISEPYNVFKDIGKKLNMSMSVDTPNGENKLQSASWALEKERKDRLVIRHKIVDENKQTIFIVSVAKDVSGLILSLSKSQMNLAIIAFFLTLLAIFLYVLVLEKYLMFPLINVSRHLDLITKDEENLGSTLNPEGCVEARSITLSFNKLSERLSKSNKALIRQNYKLEEVIEERVSELRAAKDEAVKANNAKSAFLANMSHELRTPLHAILSFSALGVRKINKAQPEKMLEYFSHINMSGERLLHLVNSLLNLSKLESSETFLNYEQHELHSIVENIGDEISVLLADKKLKLEICGDRGPAFFDRHKIEQVLSNLLSNAVKFSPVGARIQVIISTQFEDEVENARVVCEVKDQGVGIPEDELGKVFEKFAQSSINDPGSGGTGLGLSICNEIISLHNGEIVAERNEFDGTSIRFWIPTDRRS